MIITLTLKHMTAIETKTPAISIQQLAHCTVTVRLALSVLSSFAKLDVVAVVV